MGHEIAYSIERDVADHNRSDCPALRLGHNRYAENEAIADQDFGTHDRDVGDEPVRYPVKASITDTQPSKTAIHGTRKISRLASILAVVYSREEMGMLMTKARVCSLRSLTTVAIASCAPTATRTVTSRMIPRKNAALPDETVMARASAPATSEPRIIQRWRYQSLRIRSFTIE